MKQEKVNFKNSRGLNLVGILNTVDKKTRPIIIMSHGFTANKDRKRFIETSEEFSNKGFAVLRYDFGGSKESDDTPVTVENYVDDLKSAIKYVKEKGYTNIGLLGESLGGLASVKAYDEKIKSLVLWSSVTTSKIPTLYKENKKELEEKGFIMYEKDNKKFKIPQQYFDERMSVNQEKILSKIKCPVLIIYGDKDSTIPLEDYKNALKYLPQESKLEIIKGASHNLEEKIDKVIELSLNWLKKYLK